MPHPVSSVLRLAVTVSFLASASLQAQSLQLQPPLGGTVQPNSTAVFTGVVTGNPGPAPFAKVYVRTRYPNGSLCPPFREDGAYDPNTLGWGYDLDWDEANGTGMFLATAQWMASGNNFIDVYYPGDLLGTPQGTLPLTYQPQALVVAPIVIGTHALQRSVDLVDASGQPGKLGFRVDLINPSTSLTQSFDLKAKLRLPDQSEIYLPLGGPNLIELPEIIGPGDMSKVSTVDPASTLYSFALDQAPFPQPAPLGLYNLSVEAWSGATLLANNTDIGYWVSDRANKPFRDVTAQAGLDVVALQSGINPESGACAATFDYDGDGLCDIFVSNPSGSGTSLPIGSNWPFPGGRNWLLRNQGNGTFADVTQVAGVAGISSVSSYGVAWGDLDRDGDNDLVVANRAFRLYVYRNNGDGTFTDVFQTSFAGNTPNWWMTPRLGDWDDDGDLDLYVACYMKTFASTWKNTGWASRLYSNRLNEGQFDPLAPGFPVFSVLNNSGANSTGLALAACFVDYDRDGALDLAVQHDFGAFAVPNRLFRGAGNGSFTEVSLSTGYEVKEFSMGVVFADFSGDQTLDAFSTNIGRDSLLIGQPGGSFLQGIEGSGAEGAYTLEGPEANGLNLDNSWGPLVWDYDWDGDWDLSVAGSSMFSNGNMSIALAHPDTTFRNDGGTHFTLVAEELGLANAAQSKGLFAIDYDNDGDDDCLSVNLSEGLTLYRNDLPRTRQSLRLRPRTQRSAPGGFNTFFRLTPAGSNTPIVHELLAESSHSSQADNFQRFGLGSASEAQVRAEWTSGGATTWFHLAAGAEHLLHESLITIEDELEVSLPVGDALEPLLLGRPGALVVGLIGDPSVPTPFVFPGGENLDLFPFLVPPFFKLGLLDAQGQMSWNLGTIPPGASGAQLDFQLLELDPQTLAPLAKSSLATLSVL